MLRLREWGAKTWLLKVSSFLLLSCCRAVQILAKWRASIREDFAPCDLSEQRIVVLLSASDPQGAPHATAHPRYTRCTQTCHKSEASDLPDQAHISAQQAVAVDNCANASVQVTSERLLRTKPAVDLAGVVKWCVAEERACCLIRSCALISLMQFIGRILLDRDLTFHSMSYVEKGRKGKRRLSSSVAFRLPHVEDNAWPQIPLGAWHARVRSSSSSGPSFALHACTRRTLLSCSSAALWGKRADSRQQLMTRATLMASAKFGSSPSTATPRNRVGGRKICWWCALPTTSAFPCLCPCKLGPISCT